MPKMKRDDPDESKRSLETAKAVGASEDLAPAEGIRLAFDHKPCARGAPVKASIANDPLDQTAPFLLSAWTAPTGEPKQLCRWAE